MLKKMSWIICAMFVILCFSFTGCKKGGAGLDLCIKTAEETFKALQTSGAAPNDQQNKMMQDSCQSIYKNLPAEQKTKEDENATKVLSTCSGKSGREFVECVGAGAVLDKFQKQ